MAFVAGVAAFALVAVALAVAESGLFAALFGAACVAAVIAIARRWGVAYAVPSALAALLAYDWYQFLPTHAEEFPSSGNLANLVVYLAVSVLVGELAASAARRGGAAGRRAGRVAARRDHGRARRSGRGGVHVGGPRSSGSSSASTRRTSAGWSPTSSSVAVGAWSRTGRTHTRSARG